MPYYMIDVPSPFDPISELETFLKELATLPQTNPQVQDALASGRRNLAFAKKLKKRQHSGKPIPNPAST